MSCWIDGFSRILFLIFMQSSYLFWLSCVNTNNEVNHSYSHLTYSLSFKYVKWNNISFKFSLTIFCMNILHNNIITYLYFIKIIPQILQNNQQDLILMQPNILTVTFHQTEFDVRTLDEYFQWFTIPFCTDEGANDSKLFKI